MRNRPYAVLALCSTLVLALAAACGGDGSGPGFAGDATSGADLRSDGPALITDLGGPPAGADTTGGLDGEPPGDGTPPPDDSGAVSPPDAASPPDVAPNEAPTFGALPPITLEMTARTTIALDDYIADAEDPDGALTISWTSDHVALSDTGDHVMLIVAPADWHGVEVVPLTVTDTRGDSASAELTVTVEELEGPPPIDPECGQTTFHYAAGPNAAQILVSGTFNGWADTAAGALVMSDDDGDHVWEATITLEPGRYPYKYIVDGVWLADPDNPLSEDDGLGGSNSVLVIPPCGDPLPPPPCEQTRFSYPAGPGVGSVLVSGSFNDWGDTPDTAFAMDDDDGDHLWGVTVSLDPGRYEYKLIVDGAWIVDPNNPHTVPNEFGGENSVVDVPECGGAVEMSGFEMEVATGRFHADFVSATGEPLDPAAIEVSVDWTPAPEAVTLAEGGLGFALDLADLAWGIHDVRVGSGEDMILLKVYSGVSTDWRDALLYFAMTDRFANGDPSNDAPFADVDGRTNYQGGDFRGITGRIEDGYFDDLGVSALWISWPVDNPDYFEEGGRIDQDGCGLDPTSANYVPMRYTGYHGYWPSDLDETDEHFGTLAELQELVVTAHEHGIRILLDFTANHVHDSSPFFAEHRDDGFFNFPTQICQDVGWDTAPKTCWFTGYLPDLNYHNGAARDAVVAHAIDWVKKTGADGFRFDAVKHLEMSFIEALRQRTRRELERTGVDFYLVGETFTGNAELIASFLGPNRIHGQFDFPSNNAILRTFATREMGLDGMDDAVRAHRGTYGPGALMSTFLGNHDIARFVSMAAGMIPCGVWDVTSNIAQGWRSPPGEPGDDSPYRRLRLAFTYLLTTPGLPLIYYGDELGMPGAGDPDNRRFMRFGAELSGRESATLDFLQRLGQARAGHASLRTGDWSGALWKEGSFLAWGRTLPDEKSVILINLGPETRSGDLRVADIGIGDGATLRDVLWDGGSATVSSGSFPFSLPGESAAIFVTP